MEELVSRDDEIMNLNFCLNQLRQFKQNGILDLDKYFSQQTIKWRNILKYDELEMYIRHEKKEYRLDTLALLVESKKSTLRFTSKELDMILLFLRYNLCEKIEYLPFIKKGLKRFRNSLAVMQRQWAQKIKLKDFIERGDITSETDKKTFDLLFDQALEPIKHNIKDYTMFYVNLREICVNNLYPDATYHRRHSSLQILSLAQELLCDKFKDIEWRKEQITIIFQCLLLDTYESNKEMAYQLLKHTNPVFLFSDLRSQTQMIEVAFELGKSIRPIDSITAAYILKISLLSPVIKDVLHDILQKLQSFESDHLNYCDKVDDNITQATTLQLILLLYRKLKEALILLKRNIGQAIVTCSVYGYLFCMRSLLSDCNLWKVGKDELWQITVNNIITLCIQLNLAVSVVVNNSSPEGHLPMDLKTLNNNDNASFSENVTPQMVLLCSWRTVKEVSHLFGLFATKVSIEITTSKDGLLSNQQIECMMSHFVSLLCETKHRGAFEQAYVGFHQLCTQLWKSRIVYLRLHPIQCLHDTLIGITGLMPGYSKLCATRRSAGVPFLIQGLLSSAIISGDSLNRRIFHSVMKILLQFTKLEDTVDLWPEVKSIMYEDLVFTLYKDVIESKMKSRYEHYKIKSDIIEIKIHSMNILRALFRHSQLSDMVKYYVADGLIVAFKHYNGRTWAEHNAATLLFSTLIVRIFGVQRTKDHINLTTCNMMTGRLFFERYPSLLPFILNELRTFISTNDTMMKSNVQAILLLLSRLYIDDHFKGDLTWEAEEMRNLVSRCAKSPVHQTRELAARALIPLLIDEDTAYATLSNLFQLVLIAIRDIRVFRISANLVHGYMLQILKILKKFWYITRKLKPFQISDFLSMSQCILNCPNSGPDGFNNFPLATIYIDILCILYQGSIIDHCQIDDIFYILIQCLIKEDLSKPKQSWPGEQTFKVSVIRFILSFSTYSKPYKKYFQTENNGLSKAFKIWSRLLVTPEAEVQIIAWDTISRVLTENYEYESRKLMTNQVILVADNFTEDLHKYSPDVLDAFFSFLNCYLEYTKGELIGDKDKKFTPDHEKTMYKICTLVLRKIHSHDASNVYIQRVHYLMLLGKCMIILVHYIKDEDLKMEYKKDIYRRVCSSDWISTTLYEVKFRDFIHDIICMLFDKDDINIEQCHPVLDWWTMALQLLVDDNAYVRSQIYDMLRFVGVFTESGNQNILLSFFEKFNSIVASKCPEIAISALFCWSVSLLGDTDYEMDETDVFSKCRNYDVFEPVQISQMCYELIVSIMQRYSIDNVLPPNVIEWINFRLGTTFVALSFREIVHLYISNIPKIKKELVDILDPTYKDKLLQNLACEKYMTL